MVNKMSLIECIVYFILSFVGTVALIFLIIQGAGLIVCSLAAAILATTFIQSFILFDNIIKYNDSNYLLTCTLYSTESGNEITNHIYIANSHKEAVEHLAKLQSEISNNNSLGVTEVEIKRFMYM